MYINGIGFQAIHSEIVFKCFLLMLNYLANKHNKRVHFKYIFRNKRSQRLIVIMNKQQLSILKMYHLSNVLYVFQKIQLICTSTMHKVLYAEHILHLVPNEIKAHDNNDSV